MQRATLTALIVTLALHSSCALFNRRQPPPMPAPPTLILPERARTPTLPPELGEPPLLEPEEPSPSEVALEIPVSEEVPPYQPQRAKVRRSRHAPQKEEREEEPAETFTEESSEPAPQLVQILTPQERKQYDQAIDENLTQAEKSLSAVTGRNLNLNSEQTESVNLIGSFIRQAKDARDQDPLRARSLAERASVLAQHLEKSFR